MNVYCLTTAGGKPAPNQIVMVTKSGERYLKSYNSFVACINPIGQVSLGKDWEYSATTVRYVKEFTGLNLNELRKLVEKQGVHDLASNM